MRQILPLPWSLRYAGFVSSCDRESGGVQRQKRNTKWRSRRSTHTVTGRASAIIDRRNDVGSKKKNKTRLSKCRPSLVYVDRLAARQRKRCMEPRQILDHTPQRKWRRKKPPLKPLHSVTRGAAESSLRHEISPPRVLRGGRGTAAVGGDCWSRACLLDRGCVVLHKNLVHLGKCVAWRDQHERGSAEWREWQRSVQFWAWQVVCDRRLPW